VRNSDRIDVHQHVVPAFWADELSANGGDPSGWQTPEWTPEKAIAFMDSQQISTGVLSLTAPGVVGWRGHERRDMARRVNEYTAGLVASHAGRFGNFATLPLPDLDGALLELEHVRRTLQVDGVVLLSNYGGRYLGEPMFDPLWAELALRGMLVFIHPTKPPIDVMEGIPGPIVDYPFDTTRTAVQLVLNGVLTRYPTLRIILSHAGGFLPYASMRFAQAGAAVHGAPLTPEGVLHDLRSFYFDTALSTSAAALAGLTAFARPDHILFGSDYPYASEAMSATFTRELDHQISLDVGRRASINRANALALFPRLSRC